MPELILPTERVRLSFGAAVAEFAAAGEQRETAFGVWNSNRAFVDYVAKLRADALEESPRPKGYVPCTTLWWVDGDEYLGRVAIRHRLTEPLRRVGGHIGYDVRPSARRRGYATAMLRAALPVAKALGIDPALLTCDTSNVASRKVIEANGGVLEDEGDGKLRFWVPTGGFGDTEE
jgi:predicted acetyltransferase